MKAEVHVNDKFENTNDSDAEKDIKNCLVIVLIKIYIIQERMFGSEIPRCYNFVPGHCF